jgi:hypothetical protein
VYLIVSAVCLVLSAIAIVALVRTRKDGKTAQAT